MQEDTEVIDRRTYFTNYLKKNNPSQDFFVFMSSLSKSIYFPCCSIKQKFLFAR